MFGYLQGVAQLETLVKKMKTVYTSHRKVGIDYIYTVLKVLFSNYMYVINHVSSLCAKFSEHSYLCPFFEALH